MTRHLSALLALSVLSLTACEHMPGPLKDFKMPSFGSGFKAKDGADVSSGPCPSTSVMPDLDRLTQLRSDKILSTTTIQSVSASCQTADDIVTARIKVNFHGMLAPEGQKDAKVEANYSLPYLISVIDPDGQIISKDVFAVSMIYPKAQPEQVLTDLLEQTIPLKPGQAGTDYKIMIGFQLTDDDLAYNRAHPAPSSFAPAPEQTFKLDAPAPAIPPTPVIKAEPALTPPPVKMEPEKPAPPVKDTKPVITGPSLEEGMATPPSKPIAKPAQPLKPKVSAPVITPVKKK